MEHLYSLHNFMLEYVRYLLVALVVALFVQHNWKNRWFYYYSWKIPGPFSLPFVGSLHHCLTLNFLMSGSRDAYTVIYSILKANPPFFKVWILNYLYFFTTRPEDLEIILPLCLEKDSMYNLASEFLKNTLAVQPVHQWRKARKIVTKSFSTHAINSFVEIFSEYGNRLVKELNDCQKPVDIFHKLALTNIQITCETLAGVNSNLVKGHQEYISSTIRGEEIAVERIFNPILHPDTFWSLLPLEKESQTLKENRNLFIKQLYNIKKLEDQSSTKNDSTLKKIFLQHLKESYEKENFNQEEVLDQANFLFFTAFETTATTLSCAILLLALYPEIQEKAFQEVFSIFQNNNRNITFADLYHLEYLDRVIKETMRLFPGVPLIARTLDRDIKIESYTLPAGANVGIPIGYLHRRKELWPDPLKFDPDRFLPEEVAKRHKCSYIPFSYGPRNCLGYRYAMVSMKVILSILLNNFEVKSSNYDRIDDIDFVYHIIARPKNGLFVQLEKRK